jgi:predicted homoserine dehydrogenase-like protein
MFELSKELERLDLAGTPVRVAFVGIGTMGTTFAETLGLPVGMELDIICDLRIDHGRRLHLYPYVFLGPL